MFLVAGAVSAIISTELAFANLEHQISSSSAGNASAGLTPGEALASVLIVTAPVGAAFATLQYYFAGRSLALSVTGTLAREKETVLERGRWWMVAGGAATLLGLAGILSPWLFILGGVSYVLVLIEASQILGVYRTWQAVPPPPTNPNGTVPTCSPR